MNARAYRHHTGISRLHVMNACATLLVVAGLAYTIVWPAINGLADMLAHTVLAVH